MDDQLAIIAACPNRKFLPHIHDCTFQSLYCLQIPDNIESRQVFPNDERIYAFIQNEPLKPNEIISI